ncbi:DMT family transporter [Streptomyces sp. Lzd4kr]|nr:DMT family transporter [Streptomyces sp. Lzd4kr]
MILSIMLAMLATCSNALGTVLQRHAVLTVPASASLRIGLLTDLLRTPIWLAGLLGVMLSALLQALALAIGSLAAVQPVFVLELPLALLIGGFVFHVDLPRKAWVSVVGIACGVALFLFSTAPSGGREQVPGIWWVPTLVVVGGIAGILALVGLRRPVGRVRGACIAAAAAVGNALTAALIKSAMYILSHQGFVAFLLSWQTYGFAVVGGFSLFLLSTAMQGGPLIASQPALTLVDAFMGFCIGVAVYGEQTRTGMWILWAVVALALVTTGVFALSRMECLTDAGQKVA